MLPAGAFKNGSHRRSSSLGLSGEGSADDKGTLSDTGALYVLTKQRSQHHRRSGTDVSHGHDIFNPELQENTRKMLLVRNKTIPPHAQIVRGRSFKNVNTFSNNRASGKPPRSKHHPRALSEFAKGSWTFEDAATFSKKLERRRPSLVALSTNVANARSGRHEIHVLKSPELVLEDTDKEETDNLRGERPIQISDINSPIVPRRKAFSLSYKDTKAVNVVEKIELKHEQVQPEFVSTPLSKVMDSPTELERSSEWVSHLFKEKEEEDSSSSGKTEKNMKPSHIEVTPCDAYSHLDPNSGGNRSLNSSRTKRRTKSCFSFEPDATSNPNTPHSYGEKEAGEIERYKKVVVKNKETFFVVKAGRIEEAIAILQEQTSKNKDRAAKLTPKPAGEFRSLSLPEYLIKQQTEALRATDNGKPPLPSRRRSSVQVSVRGNSKKDSRVSKYSSISDMSSVGRRDSIAMESDASFSQEEEYARNQSLRHSSTTRRGSMFERTQPGSPLLGNAGRSSQFVLLDRILTSFKQESAASFHQLCEEVRALVDLSGGEAGRHTKENAEREHRSSSHQSLSKSSQNSRSRRTSKKTLRERLGRDSRSARSISFEYSTTANPPPLEQTRGKTIRKLDSYRSL